VEIFIWQEWGFRANRPLNWGFYDSGNDSTIAVPDTTDSTVVTVLMRRAEKRGNACNSGTYEKQKSRLRFARF